MYDRNKIFKRFISMLMQHMTYEEKNSSILERVIINSFEEQLRYLWILRKHKETY